MLYQSKPSTIEAVQWTGDNTDEVTAFLPTVDLVFFRDGRLNVKAGKDGAQGLVPVPVGHWIVRQPGDLSDHWPVDPDYFAAKYEPA